MAVFAPPADIVSAERGTSGSGLSLTLTGPMAGALQGTAGTDNLVLRAARALAAALGRDEPDLALTLEKHLPVGAGLGGGSADAAATLRLLLRLWGAALPEPALATRLGADVPMCLLSRPLRATGIGETLTPVAGLPPLPLVLVNPGVPVATASVFRRLAAPADPPLPALPERFGSVAAVAAWLARTTNGLIPPAIAEAPEIGAALAALAAAPDCLLARMSGSGATCFGLFPTPAAASVAAARLGARPGWWVSATQSGGS